MPRQSRYATPSVFVLPETVLPPHSSVISAFFTASPVSALLIQNRLLSSVSKPNTETSLICMNLKSPQLPPWPSSAVSFATYQPFSSLSGNTAYPISYSSVISVSVSKVITCSSPFVEGCVPSAAKAASARL